MTERERQAYLESVDPDYARAMAFNRVMDPSGATVRALTGTPASWSGPSRQDFKLVARRLGITVPMLREFVRDCGPAVNQMVFLLGSELGVQPGGGTL